MTNICIDSSATFATVAAVSVMTLASLGTTMRSEPRGVGGFDPLHL